MTPTMTPNHALQRPAGQSDEHTGQLTLQVIQTPANSLSSHKV